METLFFYILRSRSLCLEFPRPVYRKGLGIVWRRILSIKRPAHGAPKGRALVWVGLSRWNIPPVCFFFSLGFR